MDQNKNTSFCLLSQDEIDTLVRFLTDKKNTVNSDVMSQTSIDKLIKLIKTDGEHLIINSYASYGSIDASFLAKLNFRSNENELCELRFRIAEGSNFIELFVENKETGKTLLLSPKLFNEEDSDVWGFAISPVLFTHVAYTLSVKYSQQTYDSICSLFAKQNFGSEQHKIPELFLPDNSALVGCLL